MHTISHRPPSLSVDPQRRASPRLASRRRPRRALARWLGVALPLAIALGAGALACGSPQQAPAPSSAAPAAPDSSTATRVPERFQAVHGYLAELVEQRKIAGAVALVERGGETLYLDTLGMRDVEAGLPMTPDTIFRICSMSKPITSVGVLILAEEGRIVLDDPVAAYLPALDNLRVAERDASGEVRLVPATRPITIRDLLTHTSGITYRFLADETLYRLYQEAGVEDGLSEVPGTMADTVAKLGRVPLQHQPGEAWTYGLSVDVLGHLIEVVTGQTLARFLDDRIFRPLGMKDTGFRVAPGDEARLAAVYQPGAGQTIERLPAGIVENGQARYSASYPLDRDSGYYSGGAGLVSTVTDYARFARMLLGGGSLDGVRILSPETVAMMTRNQIGDLAVGNPLSGDGFGLGVAVVSEAASHQGGFNYGSPGTYSWGGFYQTLFWVDPQEEIVAVLMTQLFPWDHLGLFPSFRGHIYGALTQ